MRLDAPAERLQCRGEMRGIARPHRCVGQPLDQKRRAGGRGHEVDRLRGRVERGRAEVVLEVVVGQRQKVIRSGEPDQALHRTSAGLGDPVRIERRQRRELRTGRVTHDDDPPRITAPLGGVALHVGDGGSDVAHCAVESHRWIQPVVGQHGDRAEFDERARHEAVLVLVAVAPAAAMPEDHDRPARVTRRAAIHRQARTWPAAVSELRAGKRRRAQAIRQVGREQQRIGRLRCEVKSGAAEQQHGNQHQSDHDRTAPPLRRGVPPAACT